jgi:hypothetical protein
MTCLRDVCPREVEGRAAGHARPAPREGCAARIVQVYTNGQKLSSAVGGIVFVVTRFGVSGRRAEIVVIIAPRDDR